MDIHAIIKTKDGGYALGVGIAQSAWLFKLDSTGKVQWSKNYGGSTTTTPPTMGSEYLYPNAIIQASDGGFALSCTYGHVGSANRGTELIRTEPKGNALWRKWVGSGARPVCNSLIQTSDKGFALTGGDGNYFLFVKTDASGSQLWSVYPANLIDAIGNSLVQTNDGGYAVAGTKFDYPNKSKFGLFRFDSKGNLQWTKTYGGIDDASAQNMVKTHDGGYALAGYLGNSVWLVKTGTTGDLQWSKTYGSSSPLHVFHAQAVVESIDEGYAIASSFQGSLQLIKTDSKGIEQWSSNIRVTSQGETTVSVIQTNLAEFVLAGWGQIAWCKMHIKKYK